MIFDKKHIIIPSGCYEIQDIEKYSQSNEVKIKIDLNF